MIYLHSYLLFIAVVNVYCSYLIYYSSCYENKINKPLHLVNNTHMSSQLYAVAE